MSELDERAHPKAKDFYTAEDFMNILSRRHEYWNKNPFGWVFRGQADATWGLVPSLFRPKNSLLTTLRNPPIDIYEDKVELRSSEARELAMKEFYTIMRFSAACDRSGFAIPEDGQEFRSYEKSKENNNLLNSCLEKDSKHQFQWPPKMYRSLYALAQHYEIPTRFLDWSWSPKVAAYFAAYEAAKELYNSEDKGTVLSKKLSVWALDIDLFVNPNRTSYMKPLPDGTLWLAYGRIQVVTAPHASNPNLNAQSGLFILDADLLHPQPLERTVENELEKYGLEDKKHVPLRKFTLSYAEAPKLLRLLAYEDVSGATVFGGYNGPSRQVLEERYWDK